MFYLIVDSCLTQAFLVYVGLLRTCIIKIILKKKVYIHDYRLKGSSPSNPHFTGKSEQRGTSAQGYNFLLQVTLTVHLLYIAFDVC